MLFALGGLPLLQAYVLIGQRLDQQDTTFRLTTTLGVVSGLVQVIGLLRWTFVVPVLATDYVTTADSTTRRAIEVVFMAVHQYGGVVLGEHLGQLFTILYTVLLSAAFTRLRLLPRYVSYIGYGASAVYLLTQGELFAR